MPFDKDEFGFIKGSLKSKAVALYKKGATRSDVENALGDPVLNVLTELTSMGYKITKKKVRVGKNRPHFKYKVEDKDVQ
jgi:hypothetical protein